MKVFLGGTCNNSTWREALIPKLKIDFFNPVVEDWTPECIETEWKEKASSDILLYVITPQMTGTFSIAELIDDSNKHPERTVACFLQEHNGQKFTDGQWKSLMEVAKMASDNGAIVTKRFDNLHVILNSFKVFSKYKKEDYHVVFLDTEFTNLGQDGELISVGMCDLENNSYYGEILDFNMNKCSIWVIENIIPTLSRRRFYDDYQNDGIRINCSLNKADIVTSIKSWLDAIMEVGKKILIVSDCLAYDWVFFAELIKDRDGNLPNNIFYVPVDIMGILVNKGIDIDINREELVGIDSTNKHNALHDAEVIRAIWKKYTN